MSISGVGSSIGSAMIQAATRPQRPDASSLAAEAFAQLDATGKGYIDQSDLASALEATGASGTSSVEDLFSALDGDSDGRVTEQELGTVLQQVLDSFENSFGAARVGQAMGGMPPPGGAGGGDEGKTLDELSAMADEAEASGRGAASELAALVQSFDEADTDGDGKVSFQEAMAYRQSTAGQGGMGDAAALQQSAKPEQGGEAMLARVLQMLSRYEENSASATASSTRNLSVSA